MAKHSSGTVSVDTITHNELVNRIQYAAGDAIAGQSWFKRRQNTLAAVAQGVLQFANAGLFLAGVLPLPLTIIVAVLIILAEIVVHAATKSPVTPASAREIERAAVKVGAAGDPSFSVYHRVE